MKDKLKFDALVKDYEEAFDFCRQKPVAAAKAYLKSLRAAEMADWEKTGGDYVLPAYATTSFHYGARTLQQDAQTSRRILRQPECRIFTIATERARQQ